MPSSAQIGLEPLDELSPRRRMPTQKRSRERVEKILDCAIQIIAAEGSDALRMSEVARLAGISIGSLYQYFPDKSAIIGTLAERYNAEGRHCIEDGLAHVKTLDELCASFARLIDVYYEIFLAEPVMRDIHSGTQADKTLRDLELEDSRLTGDLLAKAVQRVKPEAETASVASAAFLVMYLGESTMRLAISVDRKEGDRMVDAYKEMAIGLLRRLG